MLELNKVLIIGNLVRDPEGHTTPNGKTVVKITIAANRRWKSATGEKQEEAAFIDVEAWGKTAEFIEKYFVKGRRIFIEGEIRQQSWTDKESGQKRSKLMISAEQAKFAGDRKPEEAESDPDPGPPDTPRTAATRATATAAAKLPSSEAPGDDLPF